MASNSMRPLSIGNILSVGLTLYNSNLKAYSLVGLRATAWTMLMLGSILLIVSLMVAAFIPAILAAPRSAPELINWGLFGLGFLLILPAIPLWIFCGAKYLYNEVLIARHAYLRLINQPEHLRQTNQALRGKLWHFWVIRFLVVMILSVVSFIPSFFQNLPLLAGDNRALIFIFLGTYLLVQIAAWGVQLWISAKLFLAEMSIALEDNIKPPKAMNRSWTLTQGNDVFRLMLVLTVAFLLTMPLYGICVLVPFLILAAALAPIFTPGFSAGGASAAASVFENSVGWVGLAIVLYFLMLMLANIFVVPFWQTIKAAVYYDLRSRRDGLGLSLNDAS